MKNFIPLQDIRKQYLDHKKEIDTAIKNVIHDQAFIGGHYVETFEKNFAAYFESKYAIGLNSGTDALILALSSLGITKGDEVITSAFSFIATPAAIALTGAKPVFVDIDPETYNLNPEEIEKHITKKTKAILPVHLYGHLSDMTKISNIAKKHKLFIVEDACQAIGATLKNKKAGTFGDVGCFSFHPNKNLGAYGDAGAMITNSKKVSDNAKLLRNHGSLLKYHNQILGVSSRLDGIQAAILLVKLKHIKKWNTQRRQYAHRYNQLLKNNQLIETPIEKPSFHHVYSNYTLRVKDDKRDALQKYLTQKHIETAVYYPIPLHLQKALVHLKYKEGDFPQSEIASKEVLTLPLYPEMTERQITYIANGINKFA